MSRPSSISALFKRLVVLRWRKLSLNARLAVLAAGILAIVAMVSGALGAWACPARGGCCARESRAVIAPVAPAEEATPAHAASSEGAHDGCPFASSD